MTSCLCPPTPRSCHGKSVETADFVKFAKHTASEQENAAVLPLAVRFVTQTYQDDLAAQAEENKKEGE